MKIEIGLGRQRTTEQKLNESGESQNRICKDRLSQLSTVNIRQESRASRVSDT